MIDEIDRSLERWLRAAVPLPAGEADVKFDQPEKSWNARRSNPLVNLYLYAVSKSVSRAMNGSQVVPGEAGGLRRERMVPIAEARYLISVWGGGAAVEHELLGRLVNLLSTWRQVPEEHQSSAMLAMTPRVSLSLEPDTVTSLTHLWSGLGVPPRPAIQLLVYAPMGLPVPVVVPDPPKSVEIGASRSESVPAAYAQRRRVLSTSATVRNAPRRPSVVLEDSGRESGTRLEGSDE